MRNVPLILAAFLLASCGGNDVPSPAERLEGEAAAPVDEGLVTLRADGLTAGAESFFFAAGENEVRAALAATLGDPVNNGDMPECGAGPMNFVAYPRGVAVNFQDGMLVGWLLEERSDDVEVSSNIAIADPQFQVREMPGFHAIEDSTLGEEFVISGEIAGFFDDGNVSMLYAGTQCFFR